MRIIYTHSSNITQTQMSLDAYCTCFRLLTRLHGAAEGMNASGADGKSLDACESSWKSVMEESQSRSDVERAVGRPHVPHADQQHVDQCPDTQTSEAEELPQTFPPLTQIEAVRTEASQRDAVHTESPVSMHHTHGNVA